MINKKVIFLIYSTLILSLISASFGILSNEPIDINLVTSIYGIEITLYGKGVYGMMSLLRAGTYIGADMVIILLSISLALLLIHKRFSLLKLWILSGGMIFITYYASSLVFGAPLSSMFIIYVLLFSSSIFSLYHLIKLSISIDVLVDDIKLTFKKTSLFMMLAALSSLIWLTLLIPAMINNDFSSLVDINTTEPTFAIDIAMICPIFLYTGISLYQRKSIGFLLTPILLFFYTLIGVLVIFQTFVHAFLGVEIRIEEMLSLVVSFIVLSLVSIATNIYFIKKNYKYYGEI